VRGGDQQWGGVRAVEEVGWRCRRHPSVRALRGYSVPGVAQSVEDPAGRLRKRQDELRGLLRVEAEADRDPRGVISGDGSPLRGLGIAAAVTVTDIVLAFPVAYYAARMATRRVKAVLLVAVILPLWSSYLVRVFAWKVILQGNGFLDWLLARVGLGSLSIGT